MSNVLVDDIILALSIILPFANEMSIVLTNSGLPIFKNLYKICIHDDLVVQLPKSLQSEKTIVCSQTESLRRILIDCVAYLGITLNIARSTLQFGYVTGVVCGFLIIFFSMIIPTLFLSKIQHICIERLHIGIEKPFMRIFIGLLLIIGLIILANVTIDFTQKQLKDIKIDPINEKAKNK